MMWLGTEFRGILRYDGYQQQEYRWDGRQQSGLRGEVINVLYKNRLGELWTAPWRAGIYRYDITKDRFEEYPINSGKTQSPIEVQAMGQTRDGLLLATIPKLGIFYLDTANNEFIPFDPSLGVNTLLDMPGGSVLGVSSEGLLHIESASKISAIPLSQLHGLNPTALAVDGEGHVWIGTSTGHLLEYDLENRRVLRNLRRGQSQVTAIHRDQRNNLWVLTGYGIHLMDGTGQWTFLEHNPNIAGSLSSNPCLSIFEDEHGLIWIGTNKGVDTYDPYRSKFKQYNYVPSSQTSFAGNYVVSIFEDEAQRLFVCTDDGYLNILQLGGNEFQRVKIEAEGVPKNKAIWAIDYLPIGPEHYLLATTQGLFDYDLKRGTFRQHAIFDRGIQPKVRQLKCVGEDYVLMGILNGLALYNRRTHEMEIYQPRPDEPKSMANSITRIYEDEVGNIWVGSYQGLYIFDMQTREFLNINFPYGTEQELFSEYGVLNMVEHKGTLWVASFNHGLFQINLKDFYDDAHFDQPIRQWLRSDGLSDNVVYAIIPDATNNLWLTTNYGLSCFHLPDSTFMTYTMNDGLAQNEFNMYAHAKSSTGEIYIGGVNGLNSFHPEALRQKNPHAPKVYFRSVTILNSPQKDTTQDGRHSLATVSLLGKQHQPLELEHDRNFLRIEFYSDHYSSPEENIFEYKMEGIDRDWVQPQGTPSATYTDLSPGTYTLLVRAKSYDHKMGSPSILTIRITAPFWRQWWFYGLIVSLVALGLLLYLRLKAQQNERYRRELEATITERTREISLQKDMIEAQNEEMKVSQENLKRLNNSKDFIFSILSHDLRSPLTTLKGFLGLMAESIEIFSKDEIVRLTNKIRQSVSTSLDLIDNILYWSQSQNGSVNCKPQVLHLDKLVEKAVDIYHLSAEKKGIELSAKTEAGVSINADENMVFFILRNLISNALKFTNSGGYIRISTEISGEHVTLQVEDSGVGIKQEFLEKIFNPNQTFTTRGTSNEKGTGLGLKLVQQFVKLHHGKLNVESVEGSGSTFIISLPAVSVPHPTEQD